MTFGITLNSFSPNPIVIPISDTDPLLEVGGEVEPVNVPVEKTTSEKTDLLLIVIILGVVIGAFVLLK